MTDVVRFSRFPAKREEGGRKERRQDSTFFLSEWNRSLAHPLLHKKAGPAPLLQKLPPTLLQHDSLPSADTLEPVPESPGDSHEDGVPVVRLSGEEWAHLETELPPADGGAWVKIGNSLLSGGQGELRRGGLVGYDIPNRVQPRTLTIFILFFLFTLGF